jgi:hypothetical protein
MLRDIITNTPNLVFNLKLCRGMIHFIIPFHNHLFSLPFHFLFTQMRHALLPHPVQVQQHPSGLILDVKAHLGPVLQAQLLDYLLPVEMRTNTPSPIQVQFANDGGVQCAHGQVLRNQGGPGLLIAVTLVRSCVSLYLPHSGG